VESGRLFADKRFGDLKNRADKALIRDLKTVRRELIDAGLSGSRVRFAHALIGRSIFIRYLEDRDILTEAYFPDLLRTNGKAGMLVSAGVLFKHSKTKQRFRKHWLDSVRLDEVFNFSHVRKFFFKGGIAL
jgi:hypothetical protein